MSDDLQGTTGPEGAQAPPPAAPQAPPPAAGTGPANDTSKLLAAAGYIIWLVALIAILIDPYKEEAFVKHHAMQALGLAVASVALGILNVVPIIGQIVWAIGSIAIFVFAIIGAIKAFNSEYYEMPLVYGLVKQYI